MYIRVKAKFCAPDVQLLVYELNLNSVGTSSPLLKSFPFFLRPLMISMGVQKVLAPFSSVL